LPIPGINPEAAARSISPILRLPIGALTGLDVAKLDQFSRPAETYRRGPYGQELATPPATRPGELAYLATGEIPYIRTLRDLALGPENVRYRTGYQITSGGEPITEEARTPISALARGVGLPFPATLDLTDIMKRREETIARQRG
jgi:hypothetical protein